MTTCQTQSTCAAVRPDCGWELLVTPGVDRDFEVRSEGDEATIQPRGALSRRRALRPIAWFDVTWCGQTYPELNQFMGRIEFGEGASSAKRYRPFSRDPQRRLRGLTVGAELPLIDDAELLLAAFDHFRRGALPAAGATSADRAGADSARFWNDLNWHAHGWMSLAELQLLHWCAARAAAAGGHVVEFGSYQGRSSAAIAAGIAAAGVDSLLLSFDPNELSPQQADVAMANVSAVGQRRRFVQVQRPSTAARGMLCSGCADMVFVDGRHEAESVSEDFFIADELLRPGGVLALHDVYPRRHLGYEPPHSGPLEVVEREILASGRYRVLAAAHLVLACEKVCDERAGGAAAHRA